MNIPILGAHHLERSPSYLRDALPVRPSSHRALPEVHHVLSQGACLVAEHMRYLRGQRTGVVTTALA